MYILCRRDLGAVYGLVQGSHALAEYLLNHKTNWLNGTIVALGVNHEDALRTWHDRLKDAGVKFSAFYEPDLGGQMTALACVLEDGSIFKKLNLMR